MTSGASEETAGQVTVYVDLTHVGRHVTGIERIAIELFEKAQMDGVAIRPVRAKGLLGMIFAQQVWLPLLALMNPSARFAFPGFPPSPLMALARSRVVLYVHDCFLITRRQDLGLKARLYMAWPFAFAVRRLKHFLVNSEKTAGELKAFTRRDATIALYRPAVGNVFALSAEGRGSGPGNGRPLRLVALGTVEPRKNYKGAIAILSALRAGAYPDAELHVVGRPGWGEDAALMKGAPGVTVHGYLPADEAKAVIERADVYLCTSHDEGLGLPLLEAQYAGLPVVAPDQVVFREVLGGSGTFIDPADPGSAARAIETLVGTPGWREQAAAAALANVRRWNASAQSDRAGVARLLAAPRDDSARAAPRRVL